MPNVASVIRMTVVIRDGFGVRTDSTSDPDSAPAPIPPISRPRPFASLTKSARAIIGSRLRYG